MLETAVRTGTDQCLEVLDQQGAARKLQDVLSLRLPSFYRCAFRLLGNAADAEDAVQEALLAAYKHINQFRGKVSLWLGHSNLATTEVYTRADPTEKLEAIEAIVPPHLRRGSFRPPDKLIALLKAKS